MITGSTGVLIILLLIAYAHLVTSQRPDGEAMAEAAPPPPSSALMTHSPPNFYPNDLITQLLDAMTCTPSSFVPVPAAAHDGGEMISTATFTEVVVMSLLTSRKDEGTQWVTMFVLMIPSVVCVILFCEIPMRYAWPRLAHAVEQLLIVLIFNGVTAILLPVEYLWVTAACLGASLVTIILAA